MYPVTLKHPGHNEIACKESPCCHRKLSPDTSISPKMAYPKFLSSCPLCLLCGVKGTTEWEGFYFKILTRLRDRQKQQCDLSFVKTIKNLLNFV